jgi:hypothetical protein
MAPKNSPKVGIRKATLEYHKASELTTNKGNPRKTLRLGVLESSLSAYGFVDPIVVYRIPEGHPHEGKAGSLFVVCGHQRIKAAEAQKLNEELPVLVYPFKDLAEARSYGVMNNRTSEVVSTWEQDALRREVESIIASSEISIDQFDATNLGYSVEEFQSLIAQTEDMSNFKRPTFEHEIKSSGVDKEQKPKEDGNWFYTEFYGDNEKFTQLQAQLKPYMRTAHEISPEAFAEMVRLFMASKSGE